jgi:hypothetical protein
MKRDCLTRRCSRPAAGHALGRETQSSAAGLLSGRVVRRIHGDAREARSTLW